MPLPTEITTDKVRSISDLCDSETINDAIDDAMESHFAQVIGMLTKLYDLSQEQQDELQDRLVWRLDLMPVPSNHNSVG